MQDERWEPEIYLKTSDTRVKIAFEVMNGCGYSFSGKEKILDIGCGNGFVTAAIARKVPDGSVIGLDSSRSMIEAAKVKFAGANLSFIHRDARKLEFDNEFDLITSFACLHWISDQVAVLKGIEKSLKQNGQAILMYYPKSDILWVALDILMRKKKWRKYFSGFVDTYCFFDASDYSGFVGETNLNIVTIKSISVKFPNHTREEFEKVLSSCLPHMGVLPKGERHAFISELSGQVMGLFEEYGIKDFESWPYPRVDVHLRK